MLDINPNITWKLVSVQPFIIMQRSAVIGNVNGFHISTFCTETGKLSIGHNVPDVNISGISMMNTVNWVFGKKRKRN